MSKLQVNIFLILVGTLFAGTRLSANHDLNGLGLNISNYTANPSESFYLDVSVSDFIQIVSTQYSLQWDASVLQFDSITAINIPHPENLLFNTSQVSSGIITALWFDSEGDGNDLPDGTVIYQLCFTAIGAQGTMSDVSFEDSPVSIEITDIPSGGANIGLMAQNSLVTIVGDIFIINADLEIPDCENPQGGAIDLTVGGGQAPYTYSWTGPGGFSAASEDIINLETGFYYVTILDASDPPLILQDSFFVDGDFVVPLAEAEAPELYTCADTLLTLEGSNSSTGPGFSYFWLTSNGSIFSGGNTLNPTVNAPGTYQLIVTNIANGCTTSAFTEVLTDTISPVADAGSGGHINCDNIIAILNGTGSSMADGIFAFWTTFDGSILTGENTYTATANAAGTYTIRVINENNGCSATDEVMVTIDTLSPTADAGTDLIQPCINAFLNLDGTGSSTGSEFTYQWTTADGNINAGQNSLSPQVNQPGTYELIVHNGINGCTASSTVNVQLDPALVMANAGADEQICENDYLLMADLPAQNTGQWTALGSGTIESPDDNASLVSELVPGENLFVWTLSTNDCPAYAADSVTLYLESSPVTYNDDYQFPFGSLPVSINPGENDDLDELSAWEISILTAPSTGVLTNPGDGTLEYEAPDDFSGTVTFAYEICNSICPELCDSAEVRIVIEEEILVDTLVDIPNSFTPNGDGINDNFVIPELDDNPGLYPENEFIVFNRWGDVVYRKRPYLNDWQGETDSGQNLPEGTYYFILKLDISAGKIIQGDVTILK